MKNKIKIGIVLLILLSTNIVHANSGIVEANYNYANIILNNNQEEVNNLFYEGRVYVPLRYISEKFGKFVDWGQETRTVIIEVKIPKSIKIIGSEAFNWCKGLEKAVLLPKYINIESSAFTGCNNIKEVYLYKRVKIVYI